MSTKDQSIDKSNSSETPRREETLIKEQEHELEEDEELRRLLLADVRDLPPTSLSTVESNFVSYFALDFRKPGYDQCIYRHANGFESFLLAHAFEDDGGITAVDFNVGKSDCSGVKVSGKRKKVLCQRLSIGSESTINQAAGIA